MWSHALSTTKWHGHRTIAYTDRLWRGCRCWYQFHLGCQLDLPLGLAQSSVWFGPCECVHCVQLFSTRVTARTTEGTGMTKCWIDLAVLVLLGPRKTLGHQNVAWLTWQNHTKQQDVKMLSWLVVLVLVKPPTKQWVAKMLTRLPVLGLIKPHKTTGCQNVELIDCLSTGETTYKTVGC